MNSLSEKLVKISSLTSLFFFLFGDAFHKSRLSLFKILFSVAGGVFLQIVGFLFVLKYVSHVRHGGHIFIPMIGSVDLASPYVFLGMALIVVIALSLSGYLNFKGKFLGADFSRKYEENLQARVLTAAAEMPVWGDPQLNLFCQRNQLGALLSGDSALVGRAIKSVTAMLYPAVISIIGLGYLLWSHFGLTLGLLVFSGVALWRYFHITRDGVRLAFQFEGLRSDLGAKRRAVMSAGEGQHALIEEYRGVLHAWLELLQARTMVADRAKLVLQLFAATVIPTIFLVEIIQSKSGGVNWAGVVIYLVVARFTIAQLTSLFTLISNLSSIVPACTRVVNFLRALSSWRCINETGKNIEVEFEADSLIFLDIGAVDRYKLAPYFDLLPMDGRTWIDWQPQVRVLASLSQLDEMINWVNDGKGRVVWLDIRREDLTRAVIAAAPEIPAMRLVNGVVKRGRISVLAALTDERRISGNGEPLSEDDEWDDI